MAGCDGKWQCGPEELSLFEIGIGIGIGIGKQGEGVEKQCYLHANPIPISMRIKTQYA